MSSEHALSLGPLRRPEYPRPECSDPNSVVIPPVSYPDVSDIAILHEDLQLQEGVKWETLTSVQKVVVLRPVVAAQRTIERLYRAFIRDEAHISYVCGPMHSGKTDWVTRVGSMLLDQDTPFTLFRPHWADRYTGSDQSAGSYNGSSIAATPVNSILDILKLIQDDIFDKGSVIGAIELPFLGTSDQISHLVNLMREKGISFLGDGLSLLFNGQPLDQTTMMMHQADQVYVMQAYDSTDYEIFAEGTMRFVRFTVDDNGGIEMYEDDTRDAIHMKRLSMVEKMQNLERFKEMHDRFRRIHTTLFKEHGRGIAFPSHPSDPKFAIGSDRYLPMSLRVMKEIYGGLDIEFDPVDPLGDNIHENIFDWHSVGLG